MYHGGMDARSNARISGPGARIVRTEDPPNEELDPSRLGSLLTPTEDFYLRCHGAIPGIEPSSWRLGVGGLVERELGLDLDDLARLPQVDAIVTLECAGNRRTLQRPVPGGVPWVEGAVSTARWGGVRLAEVLALAGVGAGAAHVRLRGADRCRTGAGTVPFARSIALPVALEGEALLALRMNGAPLPRAHGAPARLVVPRHYGMDSVKWLTAITLSAEPEEGPFQRDDYRLWYGDGERGEEIGPVRVASAIAHPRPGMVLRSGRIVVRGAAWTGTGTVNAVELSADGGSTWEPARLLGEAVPGAWRLWEYEWEARPGTHTLGARASDTAGHRQPAALPPNRKGYANNFVVPVTVQVAD
jgi:DMSO/TMAO reductase YedYZ molybdopterin-dependent catalytic subunit